MNLFKKMFGTLVVVINANQAKGISLEDFADISDLIELETGILRNEHDGEYIVHVLAHMHTLF